MRGLNRSVAIINAKFSAYVYIYIYIDIDYNINIKVDEYVKLKPLKIKL